jgi:hypothetical protein
MKTKTINLYSFDELSDKAKENAINKLSDINIDYQWWESTYDDAENVGLKITKFDLDRNRYAKGHFISDALETANKILKEHGENCETYKTAQKFILERDNLVYKYSDKKNTEIVAEENEYDFDCECEELESEFLNSILEDYSIILQNECDYLQSSEAIIESIKYNEYDFDENGNLA